MLCLGMTGNGEIYYWGYDIMHSYKNKSDLMVNKVTKIPEIQNADMIYTGLSVGYVKKGLDIIILKSY